MQRLDLTPTHRARYNRLGALTIGASGQEVLLGLTRQESEYMARCNAAPPESLTEKEQLRYAELLVRHEKARLRGADFDAGGKNESRQG